jgi:phosphopantetheinyl transferase (holo-ACP synthase)
MNGWPISTGNDIVFLKATRPQRTGQFRFYSRILQPSEHSFTLPLPFDEYVWLCWSIKESAFKYCKRHSPDLVFAPLNIGVRRLAFVDGYYQSFVEPFGVFSRSVIRDGVIATVVSEDETFTHTRWGFRSIASAAYADQSSAVRAALLEELRGLGFSDDLQIDKNASGCPVVLSGGQPIDLPVSLSHHDHYIAWSFCYLSSAV